MLIRISSLKRLRVVLLIELVRVHRRWPSRKTLCPTGKVDQRGQEQGKEEGRISLTILVPEEEERRIPPSDDPWCSYPDRCVTLEVKDEPGFATTLVPRSGVVPDSADGATDRFFTLASRSEVKKTAERYHSTPDFRR